MKGIFNHNISSNRIEEIRARLSADHAGYYGTPMGQRQILVQTGEEYLGFRELECSSSGFRPFRWLRSSGTFVKFDEYVLVVTGRRHSIDEFLSSILSPGEIENLEPIKMHSREPDRKIGDTLCK